MKYSRQSPSPRYQQLLAMYQKMHVEGESATKPAAATFPGHSLPPHAGRIKQLLDHFASKSLLDYGSGKGTQYQPKSITTTDGRHYASIPDLWGVSVHCFDPAYAPFSQFPTEKYDAVISTDVLEHCPEQDVAWIIEEMFSLANHFVYANIACRPAKKRLPNGENAHTTIQPPAWWERFFQDASRTHGDLPYLVLAEEAAGQAMHSSMFASPQLLAA